MCRVVTILARYRVASAVDFVRPVEAIVPGAQGRVLAVVAETSAELNLRPIAELAGVSQAQVSRVLPGLVDLGVLERREVPPVVAPLRDRARRTGDPGVGPFRRRRARGARSVRQRASRRSCERYRLRLVRSARGGGRQRHRRRGGPPQRRSTRTTKRAARSRPAQRRFGGSPEIPSKCSRSPDEAASRIAGRASVGRHPSRRPARVRPRPRRAPEASQCLATDGRSRRRPLRSAPTRPRPRSSPRRPPVTSQRAETSQRRAWPSMRASTPPTPSAVLAR